MISRAKQFIMLTDGMVRLHILKVRKWVEEPKSAMCCMAVFVIGHYSNRF